jgi:hypothetical protein
LEELRTALNNASDDDSIGGAPDSDAEEEIDSDNESESNDITEWLILDQMIGYTRYLL